MSSDEKRMNGKNLAKERSPTVAQVFNLRILAPGKFAGCESSLALENIRFFFGGKLKTCPTEKDEKQALPHWSPGYFLVICQ